MEILVLGATGMLGSTVCRLLAQSDGINVTGVVRTAADRCSLVQLMQVKTHIEPNILDSARLAAVLSSTHPDVVVNCIGLIKQIPTSEDPLVAIPINTLFPHRLAGLCRLAGARVVHISTDCVFSGNNGNYRETDSPDADDLYGRSKLLGELEADHTITLRTSIIGPELNSAHGLLGWFLSQTGTVNGYRNAIFSGLPTIELARVMRDEVLPRPSLSGLYHVSAEPISKLDLLTIIARVYCKDIEIKPVDEPSIDRSLNSDRFQNDTSYVSQDWNTLVERMHAFG